MLGTWPDHWITPPPQGLGHKRCFISFLEMNAWQCVGVTLRRCQGCTWKPGPYFSSPCPALSCSSICKHCSLVFRHRCLPLHAGSQAPSPKGPFPTWIVIFKRNSLDQLGMLGPHFPSLTRPISNPCDISVGPRTPVTGRNTFKRVALESWRWQHWISSVWSLCPRTQQVL